MIITPLDGRRRSGLMLMVAMVVLGLCTPSCSDTSEGIVQPAIPAASADSLLDFFPPLAVGDTLSWRYILGRAASYGEPSAANGTILWTVTSRSVQGKSATMRIASAFTGTVTTPTAASPHTDTLVNVPCTDLVITVDSSSIVNIVPVTSYRQIWDRPPVLQMPRYQRASLGDTLLARPSYTTTVRARRDYGIFAVTYDDGTEVTTFARGPVVITPPPPQYDHFPGFSPGDTLSWSYTSGYTSPTGPGYRITGTMRWTVIARDSVRAVTTTIPQRLSGSWTRWSYAGPESSQVVSDTTYVTIVEWPYNRIELHTPFIWRSSTTTWQGWLLEWTLVTPRYAEKTANDTLTSYTGTGTYGGTVYAKRGFGPVRLTYDESYPAHAFANMVRR